MPHGEKIELKGHGHQVPDMGNGDLIVVVGVKKHPVFTRKGADLHMRKEVSLYQALTGVEFTIKHLDGRKVRIQSEPGMVIDHEMKMTAEGLGMPFFKKSFINGNLFITFDVKFPKSLTELQMNNLSTALSEQVVKMNKKESEEQIETAKLTKMLDHHKNINAAGGKHGRDSDDEQEEEDPRMRGQGGQRGPGGMEC
jgi:DnaJ family protein A protein 2